MDDSMRVRFENWLTAKCNNFVDWETLIEEQGREICFYLQEAYGEDPYEADIKKAWNELINSDIDGGLYDQISAKWLEDQMDRSDLFDVAEIGFKSRDQEAQKLKAENEKQQKDLKIVYESIIAQDYIAAIEILSEVLKEDE